MAPVPPYIDTESGLLVQALDAAAAMRHVDTLPCLVHLLPQFRVDALSGFATGKDKDIGSRILSMPKITKRFRLRLQHHQGIRGLLGFKQLTTLGLDNCRAPFLLESCMAMHPFGSATACHVQPIAPASLASSFGFSSILISFSLDLFKHVRELRLVCCKTAC